MNLAPGRRLVAVGAATALATLGLAHTAVAADQQYLCGDNTQPITTESNLVKGEAVTAKTVVTGTDPTTLSGTYIGAIQDGVATGKDMLLIRLTGTPVEAGNGDVRAGIWAGMSGSPVYDAAGNLIGAVAYGLTSSSTNIAGVTPIADMKAIGASSAKAARQSVTITRANGTSAAVDALAGGTMSQLRTVPVATGTLTSALHAKLVKAAKKAHTSNLFTTQATATSAKLGDVTAPLEAGGNLFVGYSSGGMTLGGLGTVTAVCGDKIWGFGHPMDQSGVSHLSIANADAAAIIPDDTGVTGSFKQAATIGEPVGTLNQDRTSGVTGTVGAAPTGLSLTSTFTGPLGKTSMTSTVYSDDYAAMIALYQAYGNAGESLDAAKGYGSVAVAVDYKATTGQSGTARTSQFESDPYGVGADLAYDAANTVAYFSYAPTDVAIKAIRISGTLGEGYSARSIAGIQVKSAGKWKTVTKLTARKGAKITYRAVLNPSVGTGLQVAYTAPRVVTVPANATGGRAILYVIGGYGLDDGNFNNDEESNLEIMGNSGESWKDFIKDIQGQERNDGVYGTLYFSSTKHRGGTAKSLGHALVGAVVSGGSYVRITYAK